MEASNSETFVCLSEATRVECRSTTNKIGYRCERCNQRFVCWTEIPESRLLAHHVFSVPFNKTSEDTLKIFVRHTFNSE
jgi:hypothetical protein